MPDLRSDMQRTKKKEHMTCQNKKEKLFEPTFSCENGNRARRCSAQSWKELFLHHVLFRCDACCIWTCPREILTFSMYLRWRSSCVVSLAPGKNDGGRLTGRREVKEKRTCTGVTDTDAISVHKSKFSQFLTRRCYGGEKLIQSANMPPFSILLPPVPKIQ